MFLLRSLTGDWDFFLLFSSSFVELPLIGEITPKSLYELFANLLFALSYGL
jgi:hypothetical protein